MPRYRELYRRGSYLPAEYKQDLARRVAPILARHGLDRRRGGRARGVGPGEAEHNGVPEDDEGGFPPGSMPVLPASERGRPQAEQLRLL